MKLASLRPNERLLTSRDDFDRLFDRFMTTWPFRSGEAVAGGPWSPDLDFSETDKEYLVRLEVPGIPRSNIQVEVNDRTLFISGYRETTEQEKGENLFRREREFGRFTRSVEVPLPVEAEKVTATMTDGVLTVRLPKGGDGIRTRVEVK